jgi:cbb3-type cytochrome oxidase subunit 3
MSQLSPNQITQLAEVLSILMGIAIVWLVYHRSDRAELPGEATIPEPGEADDAVPETTGRTL